LLTQRRWHDLLYDLGLFGQAWLHVDAVMEAYLTWRLTGQQTDRLGTEGWGQITEEKLVELLRDPRANLPQVHQRLIVNLLHHLVCPEDVPMPALPRVN
jgi:hypothetical protein